jgi:hypothetical protein
LGHVGFHSRLALHFDMLHCSANNFQTILSTMSCPSQAVRLLPPQSYNIPSRPFGYDQV